MKCGYEKCNKEMGKSTDKDVMEQGIMRNGIWYCSLAHYEEQLRSDWRKKSTVDHQRKCHNVTCFNTKPTHFWERLKKGEGFEKDGDWYCSTKCYEESVKRIWQDERDRYLSQSVKDKVHKIKFGALLMQDDVITSEQLEDALEHSKHTNKRIGESLLDLGYISEDVMTKILSRQEGVRKMDLTKITLKPNVISLLSKEQANKYKALPVEILKRTNSLIIAISDPSDRLTLIDLRYITGYNIEPFIVPESTLRTALKRYYNLTDKELNEKEKGGESEKVVTDIKEGKISAEDLAELKNTVNIVLSGAKAKGADNFDMYLDGNTVKGSFNYGDVECNVTFKKKGAV